MGSKLDVTVGHFNLCPCVQVHGQSYLVTGTTICDLRPKGNVGKQLHFISVRELPDQQ
jgi:hypothetical protein